MMATMSVQDQSTRMTQSQEHRSPRFHYASNAAGGPLPIIPRRSHFSASNSCPFPLVKQSSSSSSASSPPTVATNDLALPASASSILITPATPPKDDPPSSSIPGKRRRRDERVPNPNSLYPPELSTPIPTYRSPSPSSSSASTTPSPFSKSWDATPRASNSPLLYTPGMPLRFSMESLRKASNGNVSLGYSPQTPKATSPVSQSSSTSSVGSSQGSASLIRKKSGQVVRSSLKSSHSLSRAASTLSVRSPIPTFPSSKSEPSTPIGSITPTLSKAVHFDKNLEQVKLFLAGQKPLAVSREGSPVDTDEGETCTSGTDCEMPKTKSSSIGEGDKQSSTKLVMHTNIPPRSAPFPPSDVNVALESLTISPNEKDIVGSILVRNLAFEKKVSVRFSFDGWSTVSEVTARWEDSIFVKRAGKAEWDRFGFVIWLGDLRLGDDRDHERKLELAVRYHPANSCELWDNNGGDNYVATFSRSRLPEEKERGRRIPSRKKADPVPFSDDELSDLLAKARNLRKSRSISPTTPSVSRKEKGSKSPVTTPCPPGPLHTRTRSFPFSSSSSGFLVEEWMDVYPPSPSPPFPKWLPLSSGEKLSPINTQKKAAAAPTTTTTLGSPRDLGDDSFHPHRFIKFPTSPSDAEEGSQRSRLRERTRRHQRGGCFGSPAEITSLEKDFLDFADTPLSTPTPTSSSRFASLSICLSPVDLPEPEPVLVEECVPFFEPVLDKDAGDMIPAPPPLLASGTSGGGSESSSSASTLLENETPPSSRSSSPPLDKGQSLDLLSPSNSEEVQTYSELLSKFCFFTGRGSPYAWARSWRSDSDSSKPTLTTGSA